MLSSNNKITKSTNPFDRFLVRAVTFLIIVVLVLSELVLYYMYLNPRVTSKAQRDYIYFSAAVKENPEDVGSYLSLADAYMRLGDENQALKVLKEAEKVDPDDYRPTFERGHINYLLGNKEKAKELFERSLQKERGNYYSYFYLGKIYYEEERYSVAAFYFSRAISIDETMGSGHIELGKCYEKMELYQSALEQYQLALKYLPNNEQVELAIRRIKKNLNED